MTWVAGLGGNCVRIAVGSPTAHHVSGAGFGDSPHPPRRAASVLARTRHAACAAKARTPTTARGIPVVLSMGTNFATGRMTVANCSAYF